MGATSGTVTAGSNQCDARLRTNTRVHAVGDRCPKRRRFVLSADGITMLVCRQCARVVGMTLAKRGIPYSLRELPRVLRQRRGWLEAG